MGARTVIRLVAVARELFVKARGELRGEVVGNVLNDAAAADLGERAGQFDGTVEPDLGSAVLLPDFVGDARLRAVAAPAVDA